MKKRVNQKARRKPFRQIGVYKKNGIERVVILHPTKGFRDRNIERSFSTSGVVRAKSYKVKALQREDVQKILHTPMAEQNKPDLTTKRKTGS